MSELFKDPMFFYSIAFVIFLSLAYRYGRVPFLNWIDGEILKVRTQLDEAQKLRVDAEKTLAVYKERQSVALAEAEALVQYARQEAAQMKAKAEADLKAALARHEQQATDRIRLAEAAAIAEVRQHAIDLAMDMARQTLAAQLTGDAAADLIDQAIAELPTAGNADAKAA